MECFSRKWVGLRMPNWKKPVQDPIEPRHTDTRDVLKPFPETGDITVLPEEHL